MTISLAKADIEPRKAYTTYQQDAQLEPVHRVEGVGLYLAKHVLLVCCCMISVQCNKSKRRTDRIPRVEMALRKSMYVVELYAEDNVELKRESSTGMICPRRRRHMYHALASANS